MPSACPMVLFCFFRALNYGVFWPTSRVGSSVRVKLDKHRFQIPRAELRETMAVVTTITAILMSRRFGIELSRHRLRTKFLVECKVRWVPTIPSLRFTPVEFKRALVTDPFTSLATAPNWKLLRNLPPATTASHSEIWICNPTAENCPKRLCNYWCLEENS